MYIFDLDIIGTHLSLRVDSSSSVTIDEDFSRVRSELLDFETRYSRFIPENWLHILNRSRTGVLDSHAYTMLVYALYVADKTGGYFDPTIGKKLRDLGYGNPDTAIRTHENIFDDILIAQDEAYGDYHDVHIE